MGCRTLNILFVYKDSSTYQRYNYFSYQAHKDRRVTKVIDKDTDRSTDNLIITELMIVIHRVLSSEGERVQNLIDDYDENGSLQEFRLSFNFWATVLMYHADIEDENMTLPLTDYSLARDNESEHAELSELFESISEYLDNHSSANLERNVKAAAIALQQDQHERLLEALEDVLDVLNNEIGRNKVVARTLRHLYGKVVNLRICQDDHFESEEALVLPEVESKLSIEDKNKLARKLLIDDESDDPNWLVNWLFEKVDQNDKDKISRVLDIE